MRYVHTPACPDDPACWQETCRNPNCGCHEQHAGWHESEGYRAMRREFGREDAHPANEVCPW